MSGQTGGLVVGFLGLTTFAVGVVAIRSGALDEVVAAAAPTVGAAVVVGLAVLVAASKSPGRATGSTTGGGPVLARGHVTGRMCGCGGRHGAYRGSSGKRAITAHERDGHGKAMRKAGAGGFTWEIERQPDGSWTGVTSMRSPHRWKRLAPEKKIAILRAGVAAAPRTFSPTDGPEAAAILRQVPARDRDRVDRDADRLVKEWI